MTNVVRLETSKTSSPRGISKDAMLGRVTAANTASVEITVGHDIIKGQVLQLDSLRTLIGMLPNLAYLKNNETQQFIYINEGFQKAFVNEEFVVSDNILEKINECERKVLESNESIFNEVFSPLISADGYISQVMLNFYPLHIGQKRKKYVLCYGYDVTKNISSYSLYTMYKDYYKDEKQALKKYCSAIGLSDHLDGKHLSYREFECLIMLSKGLSAKEMAKVFDISNRTVENHLMNIKEKFDVKSNIELLSIFLSCYRLDN